MFKKNVFKAIREAQEQHWKDNHSEFLMLTKYYVECEGCGCVLRRSHKWKLPSTIKINVPLGYGTSGPLHVLARMQATALPGTSETIQEHYKCGRCQGKKK